MKLTTSIHFKRISSFFVLAIGFAVPVAHANDIEKTLVIENHRFMPEVLKVPANKKIKLIISNLDSSAEEFESHDLNREKLIPPNARVTIYIGPLSAGQYSFFGEFYPKTAQGKVIAE